ncbi:hypothetical protein, partial [Acinetobacter baumannii]|uniref:hypothetical protein n=1 Tax=Acinetobacter baumannii TaxID=470 RepID=UPI0028CD3202
KNKSSLLSKKEVGVLTMQSSLLSKKGKNKSSLLSKKEVGVLTMQSSLLSKKVEWVHVQLHQQKGMISLSPPTICNSAPSRCAECITTSLQSASAISG